MIQPSVNFSPTVLAIAPRPLKRELTSSWMNRVAAANLIRLGQLLAALVDRYPELRSSGKACLDHRLPAVWSRALAEWCRLDEGHIRALDLDRWFPGSLPSWFSRRCAPANQPDLVAASPEWTAPKFCPRCLQQQVQAGLPIYRPVEWAPAFVTHCPEHFGQPLWQHCLCCHRQDSGWMITVRGSRKELCCRHCAVALHYWSGAEVPETLSASLQVTLRLESTLLGCLRGKPPDPFWVGPVDTEAFINLTAELLALLSQRDRQGVWTLADHLASGDWWDNHILGYEALTALEWQQHLSSRLKLVASLAKCLLGPRALEFFRFRSAACLGQKSLYPFAIVLRQLLAERRADVLERTQHWPEPIAENVSRALKALLQRFPGREMS